MFTPIEKVIKSSPKCADTERAEWTGKSERAQFQAAKIRDRRPPFGKRRSR